MKCLGWRTEPWLARLPRQQVLRGRQCGWRALAWFRRWWPLGMPILAWHDCPCRECSIWMALISCIELAWPLSRWFSWLASGLHVRAPIRLRSARGEWLVTPLATKEVASSILQYLSHHCHDWRMIILSCLQKVSSEMKMWLSFAISTRSDPIGCRSSRF